MRRISTRALVLTGLLVALLLAGVVSYYASSSPDGLEHVAQEQGFAHTANPHNADDGPLAGYSVRGVDNARLSGGLAGVAGAAVVLVLAGGLTLAVRRRGASPDDDTAGRDSAGAGKV